MHFSGLLKSLWAMCGSGPATRRVLFHWLLRRANAGRAAKKSRVRRRGRWKESYNKINILCALVDGVGFEPTVASPPRRFSRPVPSTTRPPIHSIKSNTYDFICSLNSSNWHRIGTGRFAIRSPYAHGCSAKAFLMAASTPAVKPSCIEGNTWL